MDLNGRQISIYEIFDMVKQHIKYLFENNKLEGLDFEPTSFLLYGSRSKGLRTIREDSDIDILMEYIGTSREDDVFNVFHYNENILFIEGVPVDINPKKIIIT